ncbi:chaperonin 10-like protein [Crepidotus variabilis]|uniref:Chaperonin 10-like protein n=1 Tax=Crepidotus variabilis TaxID=179855 RepID=A0A9P6EE70_9AGAR|nr:chaperonin 10-like protein [Crepidotus variabilis]
MRQPMQKALLLPGSHQPFIIEHVPLYTPGQGEILIEIHAAALNSTDWKIQQSDGAALNFPAILGSDRAGEVIQIGEGVENFKKGDRVVTISRFVQNPWQGFQQFALADAVYTSKIPAKISYDEASTISTGLTTAASGLFAEYPHGAGLTSPFAPETQGIHSGKPIMVIGGSSSVGQYAIQLARLSGFTHIITTASPMHEHYLKSIGATEVIDWTLEVSAVVLSVAKIITSQPIGVVYDTIGTLSGSTAQLGIAIINHFFAVTGEKGVLVTTDLLPATAEKAKKHEAVELAQVHAAIDGVWNQKLVEIIYQEKLYGWLDEGLLKPNRFEIVKGGLAGVAEGLTRLQNHKISGHKLVVHPQDTL